MLQRARTPFPSSWIARCGIAPSVFLITGHLLWMNKVCLCNGRHTGFVSTSFLKFPRQTDDEHPIVWPSISFSIIFKWPLRDAEGKDNGNGLLCETVCVSVDCQKWTPLSIIFARDDATLAQVINVCRRRGSVLALSCLRNVKGYNSNDLVCLRVYFDRSSFISRSSILSLIIRRDQYYWANWMEMIFLARMEPLTLIDKR